MGRALVVLLDAALVVVAPPDVAAQNRADPAKVLRVFFAVAETGFDPQATSDP